MKINSRTFLVLLAAIAFLSVGVEAQSTWLTNALGTNLSTGANWNGGTVPANSTAWVFGSSLNALLNNDFAAGWTNTGMSFSAGSSAFTLNGNNLTLNGDITNNSTATQTFGMAMSSGTARRLYTSANGGNLVFNGPISFTSSLTFTNRPQFLPGIVFLNAANSLTGTLDASAPYTTVVVGNTGALGNALFRGNFGSTFSSLVLSVAGGGTLANSIGGAGSTGGTFNLVSDRPTPGPGLTYSVNGTITNGSSQSTLILQRGGNVTSGSAGLVLNSVIMGGITTGSNLQTVNALSSDVTINTLAGNNPTTATNATMNVALAGWTTNNKVGAINNGGSNNNIMILSLYKAGPGTWTMTGSNSYTGFTAIQGGTLAVDYTTNTSAKVYSGGVLILTGGNLATVAGSGTETVSGVQTTGGQNQVIAAAGTKINLGNLTETNKVISLTGSMNIASSILFVSSTNGLAVGQTITGLINAQIIKIIDGNTVQMSATPAMSFSGASLASGTFTAGGAVNFAGAGTITTTSANTASGILGGRFTINGTDFAANDGSGNIVAYTNASNLQALAASNTAATNYQVTGGGTLTSLNGSGYYNTLKINSSTGGSQTLTVPSQLTQARYGGILYTGSDTFTLNTVGSTFTNTVGLTSNSTTASVTNTVGLVVGQSVSGTGVPAGTYITAIDSVNNTITLSAAVTTNGASTLTYRGGVLIAVDPLRVNNWGNGLLVLGSIGSSLEKYGTGTIQLSQPAQTTGASIINGGAVIISNNNQLTTPGSSGVTNAVGGLTINGGALIADTTSGNNVTLDNAGNTGTNMRMIAVGINGATFDVLGNGTMVIPGSISSASNNGTAFGPITFGSSNTTGSFRLAGSGTQSYYNTFAGGVILGGGTLQLFKGETGGRGYTNVYTGTTGSATLTGLTTTTGMVVGQPVSGTGILADTFIRSIDSGTGITLSKALTANGAGSISIAANMGALGVNSNFGGSTAQNFIYFQGGTLQYSAVNTNDYSFRFAKYANQQYKIDTAGQNVTFNNPLYGANSVLTKYGTGTLTLAGGGAYDPYTGGTVINAGAVKLANQTAVVSGPLSLADNTLFDLAGYGATVTGLSATSTLGVISNSSSTNAVLTVSNTDNSSYAGTLAGGSALSLTKAGTGTLTLAGNNSYSGPTLVSDGQLAIPTGNGITNSTVTVSSAGSLSVASGGSVNAVTNSGSVQLFGTAGAIVNNGSLSGTGTATAVTLNAGSTITSGGATGITSGTLTVSSLIINGGSYNWNLQNSDQWAPAWDQIVASGNVSFNLGTNKFTIGLITNATTAWDSSKTKDFTLLTSGESINGFSKESFVLPESTTGKWAIASTGSSLVMSYAPSSLTDPFTNGLVAYYPFNGDFLDYSGSENNVTNISSGISLGIDRFGNSNAALFVNSSNASACSINPIGITANASRTLSLWVHASKNNPGNLVSFGSSYTAGALSILYGDAHISAWGSFADLTAYNQVNPLVNAWHHVVYAYSGSVSGAKIYLDGTPLQGTSFRSNETDILNTASSTLKIGNVNSVYNLSWQPACEGSSISDLRIYNRVLESNEVASLYALESGTSLLTNLGQKITFPSIPDQTFGVGTITLQGYVSSGLAVSYSVLSGPAVTSNNQLVVTGGGTVTVVASQDGDANYAPATPVSRSFVVNPADQFIMASQFSSINYGNGPIALAATAEPSGLPVDFSVLSGPATISNNVLTFTGAGTVILLKSQSGSLNYKPASNVTVSIVVNPGSNAIVFSPLNPLTYDIGLTTNLTATALSGLPVTYTSENTNMINITSNVVTVIGSGTATIVASESGNNDYSAAASVTNVLVINKASSPVRFSGTNVVYDGTAKIVSSTTVPTNLNVITTYNGSSNPPIGAGIYTVVGIVNDPNYQGSTTATLSIAQAAVDFTIISNSLNGSYNGNAFGVSLTNVNGVPFVVTYNGSTTPPTGAGTYTVLASVSDTNNYIAYSVTNILTIAKASASVTLGNLSQTSDGSSKVVSVTTVPSSLSTVTFYNGQSTLPVHPGAYAVSTSITDSNYTGSGSATLVVSKGAQFINPFPVIPDQPFSNALTIPVTSPTTSSGLPVELSVAGGPATISNSMLTVTGPGLVTLAADQAGNQDFYPAQRVVTSFTVQRMSHSISPVPVISNTVYGSVPQPLPQVSSSSGLPVTWSVLSGPAEIDGGYLVVTGTGRVSLGLDCDGTSLYQPATQVSTSFNSVLPSDARRSQTVTFASLSARTYGTTPFQLFAGARSSLPIVYFSSNTNVATVSGNIVTITGAGFTKITAFQPGDETWNPAAPVSQILVVNGNAQKITFSSLGSKRYGSAAFTPKASSSSKLPVTFTSSDPTVAIVTNGMILPTGVGQALITATQNGQAGFLSAAPVTQALTILPGNQTVTFPPVGKYAYGFEPIVLNATSSAGLPVTYTSQNTNVAVINGNLLMMKRAGTVKVVASQFGNALWAGAYSPAHIVTITKAPQTITFSSPGVISYSNKRVLSLNGTATSELPITYKSSNTKVLTVSGSTATITGKGTTTLTASQSGNPNYSAATPVSVTVTVQ